MSYFSTTMIDNRELHVAGVAGDVTGVRAATSLCELVQLGKHTILQKQKPLLWAFVASVVNPAFVLPFLTPMLMQGVWLSGSWPLSWYSTTNLRHP